MPLTIAAVVLTISAGAVPTTDEPTKDKTIPAVRSLEVKVEGMTSGRFGEPVVIATPDELAVAIPDRAAVAAVAKSVDFRTERVLYFAWSGSGQDRLTFETTDGKVTFTYIPGRTRDVRAHKKLFAVPNGAKFQVVKP